MNNNDFEVIHIIETFYGFSFFEINIIIFCRLWTHCGQNEQDQWQSQAHRLQYTKSKRGSETEHSGALWWMNAMDVTESSRLASVGNEIRQKQWHVGVQQVWDHGAFHRLLNWKYRTWHSLNVALGFRRSLIFCSSRLKHQISPAEKFFLFFFFGKSPQLSPWFIGPHCNVMLWQARQSETPLRFDLSRIQRDHDHTWSEIFFR